MILPGPQRPLGPDSSLAMVLSVPQLHFLGCAVSFQEEAKDELVSFVCTIKLSSWHVATQLDMFQDHFHFPVVS